jgi:type III restriction enzyme
MNLIVETKNSDEEGLREEERQKIKHAEIFFEGDIKVKFKTQLTSKKIGELIKEVYGENQLSP